MSVSSGIYPCRPKMNSPYSWRAYADPARDFPVGFTSGLSAYFPNFPYLFESQLSHRVRHPSRHPLAQRRLSEILGMSARAEMIRIAAGRIITRVKNTKAILYGAVSSLKRVSMRAYLAPYSASSDPEETVTVLVPIARPLHATVSTGDNLKIKLAIHAAVAVGQSKMVYRSTTIPTCFHTQLLPEGITNVNLSN